MHQTKKKQSGIALFLVLWILTILTVIVGEFCNSMRTEINITRNFKENTELYYVAKAGVAKATAELIRNELSPPKPSPIEAEEEETDDGKIEWRINVPIPPIRFDEGIFEVTIGNEAGKVHINHAKKRLILTILGGFDLDEIEKEIIADSILDWRDKDDLHRINGAENDYYNGLDEPYDSKNGPFDSIDELLLVKGVTPELFYGGLENMLTVYPLSEKNGIAGLFPGNAKGKKKKQNYDRININAASAVVLRSLPQMTDELVAEILAYREEKDFKRPFAELKNIIGPDIYNAISPYITDAKSTYYTVRSIATKDDDKAKRGVEALFVIDSRFEKKYRIVKWLDLVNIEK